MVFSLLTLFVVEELFKRSLKLEEQWSITLMVPARGFGIENKNTTMEQYWEIKTVIIRNYWKVKTVEVFRLVLGSKLFF